MPISVSCECGRQFRAPDSAAGKRGKCPGCGTILRVPALPPPEPVVPAEPEWSGPSTEPGWPAPSSAPAIGFRDDPTVAAAAPAQPATASPAADDDYGAYEVAPVAPPRRRAAAGPLPGEPGFVPPEVIVEPPEQDEDSPAAAARPAEVLSYVPSLQGSVRGFKLVWPLFAVLLATMLPLAWSTLPDGGPSKYDRFIRTIDHHPEVAAALDSESEKGFERMFEVLPEHRIEGAFHERTTWAHWLYAAVSGGAFFAGAVVVLPKSASRPRPLLWIGLFTGTVGILLLLAFQWVAAVTGGVWVRGGGVAAIVFYIVKFIGYSYRAATDPESGVVASMLGFTFGVGLCEEVCKALPVLWAVKAGRMSGWRDACRWGFVSGVGFGVSEGITYSSDYYNGIEGGGIYLVRFVSCVALHAVWAAAAGITLYRRQDFIHNADHWATELLAVVTILIVPMALHGLYDTLLKKDHDVAALVVALVSVAWLAWNVRKMLATEAEEAGGEAAAA
ncbi:MAG TPA: PrsW family glutamic-type intramembrane protease [Humisphaera sp.]